MQQAPVCGIAKRGVQELVQEASAGHRAEVLELPTAEGAIEDEAAETLLEELGLKALQVRALNLE